MALGRAGFLYAFFNSDPTLPPKWKLTVTDIFCTFTFIVQISFLLVLSQSPLSNLHSVSVWVA